MNLFWCKLKIFAGLNVKGTSFFGSLSNSTAETLKDFSCSTFRKHTQANLSQKTINWEI